TQDETVEISDSLIRAGKGRARGQGGGSIRRGKLRRAEVAGGAIAETVPRFDGDRAWNARRDGIREAADHERLRRVGSDLDAPRSPRENSIVCGDRLRPCGLQRNREIASVSRIAGVESVRGRQRGLRVARRE